MSSPLNIAIDGPAGAGKSTVAKKLADKLGAEYTYIDTGALYRAIAYQAIKFNTDLYNEEAVYEIAKSTKLAFDSNNNVLINGEEKSEEIRTPEVSNNVSQVATYPKIRNHILILLRKLAMDGGVVMDGRDIGSFVIPTADVKIFLTADIDQRAKRRASELQQKNFDVDIKVLKQEILLRDQKDSEREQAPLIQAPDAILLDTTNLSINEVVEEINDVCEKVLRSRHVKE
ncbi:(d)CMP kinase [Desulfuribacillus alkaliarsenatis]|uniref:Cytidylate kinase n=1 Tax=Desulfuribacillus alkaliarsenatis TaxID=766136 RepID=A0A1E5FZM2_9FIRM|nr:(d)CMP kinase [Desulfuribacillus alkaliarsenatis]OEF96027.1 cytidylate kinase [Desulfuribacillus alkaliarsenatis]